MKLAKLAAGGGGVACPITGSPAAAGTSTLSGGHLTGSASPSSSGSLVQQLLPLRLSESLESHKKSTASPKLSTESFKPKLSSSSFSPPANKSEDFVAGHNRTGSSPASIQMLSPRHLQQQQHHHPYHLLPSHPPKVPEKPASLLLQQAARGSPQMPPPPPPHHHQQDRQGQAPPQQAKVHDPETNQEIVFL